MKIITVLTYLESIILDKYNITSLFIFMIRKIFHYYVKIYLYSHSNIDISNVFFHFPIKSFFWYQWLWFSITINCKTTNGSNLIENYNLKNEFRLNVSYKSWIV